MLTFSTPSRFLWGQRMCPVVLKALSEGTLVAGMHKNFFATLARSGKCGWDFFHHSKGSSSDLLGGRDRYPLISIINLCSGLMEPLADAAGLSSRCVARGLVTMYFRIPAIVAFLLAFLGATWSSLPAGAAGSGGAAPGAAGKVRKE